MNGVSGISGQGNQEKFDANGAEWEAQLNDVNSNNGWKNEPNVIQDNPTQITDNNGQFKPEVSKILNNFIGTMSIEMTKSQSPAQKISMGDDE